MTCASPRASIAPARPGSGSASRATSRRCPSTPASDAPPTTCATTTLRRSSSPRRKDHSTASSANTAQRLDPGEVIHHEPGAVVRRHLGRVLGVRSPLSGMKIAGGAGNLRSRLLGQRVARRARSARRAAPNAITRRAACLSVPIGGRCESCNGTRPQRLPLTAVPRRRRKPSGAATRGGWGHHQRQRAAIAPLVNAGNAAGARPRTYPRWRGMAPRPQRDP